MKLYIAGPMTGIQQHNYPAFHEAARQLRASGFDVVNPAELWPDPDHDGVTYRERLRRDLYEMLDCDGVALLDGWEDSKGACLEVHVADTLELHMRRIRDWLTGPK